METYKDAHTLLPLQLCDGASAEERARWFLKPAQEFRYLNQSTCFEIPGDSNAEDYQVILLLGIAVSLCLPSAMTGPCQTS